MLPSSDQPVALNKIDAVGEVLKEMQEKDIAPGWSAYSTLASIYPNAGLVEKTVCSEETPVP